MVDRWTGGQVSQRQVNLARDRWPDRQVPEHEGVGVQEDRLGELSQAPAPDLGKVRGMVDWMG